MRLVPFVLPSLFALACGQPGSRDTIAVCFAGELDADDALTTRHEERSGLNFVPFKEETKPPERFATCAADIGPRAELVDDAGEHMWLAIDAPKFTSALFGLATNASLSLDLGSPTGLGSSPTASLSMRTDEQRIVDLQLNVAASKFDDGALVVADGGHSFPTFTSCGSFSDVSVAFTDDNGTQTAANGESKELVVDGVEITGVNVNSVNRSESSCTDGPGAGTQLTWVAVNNAI